MNARILFFAFIALSIVAAVYCAGGVGKKSGTGDDDLAKNECTVSGEKAFICKCYNENTCDGALIDDDGLGCTAYHRNGFKEYGTRASINCMKVNKYQLVTSGLSKRPEVFCPSGLKRSYCMYLYPWKHMDTAPERKEIGNNGCGVSADCVHSNGCKVQAVCIN